MQEKHTNKEPQQAEKETLKAAAQAAANMSAESLQAATTTAAKQAAAIPAKSMQTAAAAANNVPFDDDFQGYINSVLAATSYPEMNTTERAAYLQAIKALNKQLKENAAQLTTLVNANLINKSETAKHLINGTLLQVYEILDNILSCYQSDAFNTLSVLFPDMNEYFSGTKIQQETVIDLYVLLEFCRQLEAAEPFAAVEVEAYKKEKKIESVTFKEFQKNVLPRCLEKAKQLKKNPRQFAKDNGAITTIGNRLLIPSAPDYQKAFVTSIKAKGGFFILTEQTDEKTGKKKEVKTLALDINVPFIQGLFNATWLNYCSGNKTGRTKVYFTDIAKELGFDFKREKGADGEKGESRKEARQRAMQRFIIQTNQIYGTIPGKKGYVKLFNTPWFDTETELLEFESPYMMELIDISMQKEQQALDDGKHYYEWKCDLMHANAANERNKAAVEMAQRILVGVQQRGTTKPDEKLPQYKNSKSKNPGVFTWRITCKGLIEDCPQIKNQLDRQKSNSNRTHVLQRAFKAMFKILREKSDLFIYYNDVSITEIIPSYSTLNDSGSIIFIKHYGRNKDYIRPQLELPTVKPAAQQKNEPETKDNA